jgi:predicted O-methyltransferase YrrM
MTQRPSSPEELRVWTAVDWYYEGLLEPSDPALEATLLASRAAGLPDIQVSPLQGRWLHLLARALRARRILEIGTLGGYSTIWLGQALPPDGQLITVELDPKHAAIARANLARAGLEHRVEVRLGPALEVLPGLLQKGEGPFDLVFIDADKPSYAEYLEWAVRLSRRGTIILADNVVRRGDIVEAGSSDPAVQGVRRMNERLARDSRLSASALQTVGSKGHDGMLFALVLADP